MPVEVMRLEQFDDAAVAMVANLLGVPAGLAPYDVHGQRVYHLSVHNEVLGRTITLVLWPSLRRADVRIGDCAMVFKDISSVELYPGVEVMFRRQRPAGHLFVSVSGRAGMAV